MSSPLSRGSFCAQLASPKLLGSLLGPAIGAEGRMGEAGGAPGRIFLSLPLPSPWFPAIDPCLLPGTGCVGRAGVGWPPEIATLGQCLGAAVHIWWHRACCLVSWACFCFSARNSESLSVAGAEEGGGWELVWLLPLPVCARCAQGRAGLCFGHKREKDLKDPSSSSLRVALGCLWEEVPGVGPGRSGSPPHPHQSLIT